MSGRGIPSFFGMLLIALGVLVCTLSGLCTLVVGGGMQLADRNYPIHGDWLSMGIMIGAVFFIPAFIVFLLGLWLWRLDDPKRR